MMAESYAALLTRRGIVAVAGPERSAFLQGLVTNDVARLSGGQALYTGLLSPQGKLLYDFFLIEDGARILIDIASDCVADLVRRLTLYKLRAKVEIADISASYRVLALFGAHASRGAPPQGAIAFDDPRVEALGARILLPQGTTPELTLVPESVYDGFRIALGIGDTAEIGHESCYPLEANFEALHGVDFKKGCYVGQELTARMKHRGGLRKRVLPVTSRAALPAPGAEIRAGETVLGSLIATDGAKGLALLRLDRLLEAGAAPLSAGEAPLRVTWPDWLPR